MILCNCVRVCTYVHTVPSNTAIVSCCILTKFTSACVLSKVCIDTCVHMYVVMPLKVWNMYIRTQLYVIESKYDTNALLSLKV